MLECSSEAIQYRIFLSWKVYGYWFNLFSIIYMIRFVISSWVSLVNLCVLRNCPFLLDYLICWHIVIHSILLQSFYLCQVSSNVISFSSYFGYLCLLYFKIFISDSFCQYYCCPGGDKGSQCFLLHHLLWHYS